VELIALPLMRFQCSLHLRIHGHCLLRFALSDICRLIDSGRLNHNVVTHPASSLAQDRESSPVETSVLTTMLRRPSPSTNPPSRRIHVISCSSSPPPSTSPSQKLYTLFQARRPYHLQPAGRGAFVIFMRRL